MKVCRVNQTWPVILPDHIADWDAMSGWEWERFASMEATLRRTDVLYDVGTEHGALSAVYAGWVGHMVLIEPTPHFWRNIRCTWEANRLVTPLACWAGLVGTDTVVPAGVSDALTVGGWPPGSEGGEVGADGYMYLHEPEHITRVARTTIDALVHRTGIVPTAVTIDCEGAEVVVLTGALDTLAQHRPLVWVSVHPDLMERDYCCVPDDLFDLFADVGYEHTLLGIDHEAHYAAWPVEGRCVERGVVVKP